MATLKQIRSHEDALMGRKGKILAHQSLYHMSTGQVRVAILDYSHEYDGLSLDQIRLVVFQEDRCLTSIIVRPL